MRPDQSLESQSSLDAKLLFGARQAARCAWMSISVRPVDFNSESHELLAMLQVNLPALPHQRRFNWLYRSNPDGPAWSWFACQGPSGQPVGVTSVFPRLMWVGSQLMMCGQVGDFAISPGYRSLGPAVLMQRATLEPVDQGTLTFCYDCPPHDAGMAPFRRLGFKPNFVMDRYALPLRVDRQLRTRLGFHAPFLAGIGNALLRSYFTRGLRRSDLEIEEYTGPFEEEFSRLDDSVQGSDVIRSSRSAAHLNWRYREDPLQKYRVLTARRHGELVAFLILSFTKEDLTIVDLFGAEFPESALALLEALPELCLPRYQSVMAFLPEQGELVLPFLKAHFRRRDVAAKVVVYAAPGSEVARFIQERAHWSFTGVDLQA
jgi:hypothetical protein